MRIRMALGAERMQVLRLILKQGMRQTLVGLVLGSGLAFTVARSLTLVLYQVKPGDPATFGIVFLQLTTNGLVASTIPAQRATRIDPMVALRSDVDGALPGGG